MRKLEFGIWKFGCGSRTRLRSSVFAFSYDPTRRAAPRQAFGSRDAEREEINRGRTRKNSERLLY